MPRGNIDGTSICHTYIQCFQHTIGTPFISKRKCIITLVKLHIAVPILLYLTRFQKTRMRLCLQSCLNVSPPISNPISIHVFGRTKIHLTALRHRATTPTHQVVLITTITRAACGSGLHPRSCGNPLLRDDVVLPPSLAPSSYTWCDVMQPHSRVGRIITKTHSVA